MKKLFLIISIFLLLTTQTSFAQTEDKRIERLSGLAKVWGAVKYFHPCPAYREIDWDKALIDAIPKVNAAKSPTEYAAAVNVMLAALHDKQTQATIDKTVGKTAIKNEGKTSTNGKEPLRLENGVLYYDALDAAKLSAQNVQKSREFAGKFFALFPKARVVVIDSRIGDEINGQTLFVLDYVMREILPAILDKKVTLGTIRYRVHNGYPPQTGATSGGYYSGLMTDTPDTFGDNGKKPFKTPPMVVIVEPSSPFATIFSGLQSAGKAFIVAEADHLEVDSHTIRLTEGVTVEMRTTEIVAPDGSIGFVPDVVAPEGKAMTTAQRIVTENKFVSIRAKQTAANIAQVSQQDKAYAEREFPSKEYRLLALFRFWNVIQYFYPYKNLTGSDWKTILPKYIPQFEADTDALSYRITTQKMVAEIHDSHGSFNAPLLTSVPPNFLPPFIEDYAESKMFIKTVLEENSGFRVGDVILEVDSVPVENRINEYALRIAASTSQASMRAVKNRNIFRGVKGSKTHFKVLGLDGMTREIESVRSVSENDPRQEKYRYAHRETPIVQILPSGFAYVDLDRLQPNDVDAMFETIKNAPAVIFDMRGYPNGTAWPIAPRLTDKIQPIAALFDNPILEGKNIGDGDYSNGTTFTFAQRIPKRESGEVYKGKVVMLIDENAISQSEHTCLFFEAARPDITFIGTPTAGADGDVTNLILPGNIKVSFSGHSVRHADGRQLQRVGIQPTIKVTPTFKGLTEGKDEILEAAVKFLQSNTVK